MEVCPQCGVTAPPSPIEAHPYFGASTGCWALYGTVLEREYSDPQFFQNHRLTVDAYALQHPGGDDPRAIQSVNIHLIALCLFYEFHMPAARIPAVMSAIIKRMKTTQSQFEYLSPPPQLGSMTAADIAPLQNVEAHLSGVAEWAQQVWAAWSPHHGVARTHVRAQGLS